MPIDSETKYVTAMNATNLDTFEFGLLVASYFENQLQQNNDPSLKEDLKELKHQLIVMEDNKATSKIDLMLEKYSNLITDHLKQKMKRRIGDLKDDPDAQHARRFFETRLAIYWNKYLSDSKAYKSAIFISNTMRKLGLQRRLPNTVDSLKEAHYVLLQICQFNYAPSTWDFKKASELYKAKDRMQKPADDYLSRNPGIMKSTTKNYYNLICEKDIHGKVVDKFRASGDASGFSSKHKTIPFVNSISGTTFTFVNILDFCIQFHSQLSLCDLRDMVNNNIQSFIALYLNQGFHSIGEIHKVLNEPHVQQMFASHNIILDLNIPDKPLDEAFHEAQEYALTTCIKRAAEEEMITKRIKPKAK